MADIEELLKRDFIANRAKLQQLAEDAEEKATEFDGLGQPREAFHWYGFRDGILRAISVIEGNG